MSPPIPAAPSRALGVLGGSFDPIHHGHLRLALEARDRLRLAAVHLIPFHTPNHRGVPVAPAAARFAMVAAAVADEPTLVADDRELRRGRISYTVETLEELRAERGDEVPLVVLIGQDAFAGLPRWHRVEELLTLGHLAVATRPQEEEPAPTPELRLLLARFAVTDPARLAERPAGCIYRLPIPPLEISSTQLREALRAERSVRYLIPDPVLRIIETRGLYRHTP